MKELSLFTGMGGGIYGSLILGWQTVGYVEKEPYCQQVIVQRIKDGWFDKAPIYGDIKEFNEKNAHEYTNKIDVLTGGFPCQPFSVAGKRQGTSDERYLFDQIIKTIEIVRPKQLFFENVSGLLTDPAVITIYRELELLNYDVKRPLNLGSADCGNIHRRKRVWILANAKEQSIDATRPAIAEHSQQQKQESRNSNLSVLDTNNQRERIQGIGAKTIQGQQRISRRESIRGIEDLLSRPDIPEPLFCRMDDELPNWKQQLKAIGNGQDPIVMATAYQLLAGEI